MTAPRFAPLIEKLPATVPFVGPEALERARGKPFRARLGANESAFGPSPRAIAAIEEAARDAWKYGDPEIHDLRGAIAECNATSPANVVVGEGIDGLLGYLARMLVEPGDSVVTSDGAYPTFNYHVAGYGGRIHKAPYRDDREDPDALFAMAAQTGAKLVYLANPDNPMGSWHDADAIADAMRVLPEGCLLALDEAYTDCAPDPAKLDLSGHVGFEDPRLIRLRTFSKAHGLAGLRVGYGLAAKELVSAFDRIRNHFGVGRVAQAGALAALLDTDWLGRTRGRIEAARERIAGIAESCGLVPLPSATNFVAIDCGGDGALAKAVVEELALLGIFVRMPGVAPQNRCIRVSCGLDPDLDALAEALPEAVGAARSRLSG